MRTLLVLLAIAVVSPAQVEVRDHATGAAIATPLILADVAVNDFEDKAIDVVNTGPEPATVASAAVTGLYYSLCCTSAFVLQPGETQALTLHFAPAAAGYLTGALQVDGNSIFIFGRAVGAASLYFSTPAGILQAHSGTPLIFAAAGDSPTSLAGFLRNETDVPLLINSVSVSGDWALSAPLISPLTILPGEQTNLTLQRSAGAIQGTANAIVRVDQWAYAITVHPPMPNIHLLLPSGVLQSGQQAALSITFDQAPTTAIEGSVEISLETDSPVSLADPAILFPSTGTTSTTFTSAPGQTSASFGGMSTLTFQTGTTAGTLRLHAAWGYSQDVVDIHVAPAPIGIGSISATRNSNSLDVSIIGFDNTRTAGALSFSFLDSSGTFIGESVAADFTQLFSTYFFQTAYDTGGMFKMTAHFPVTGNTAAISAVQVDLINSAGDAQSNVTKFQ